MTTVRLRFAAGRYHATPWGRHVNEGVAEWPPAPYRLLRALYDVWQRKCFELPANDVRRVLEALAEAPPRFTLPRAVATHTRSYLSANEKDPTAKNLVFDSFLVFGRTGACFLEWPVLVLDDVSRATLGLLLTNLNFLGRSESWIEADLWDGPVPAGIPCEVTNGEQVSDAGVRGELVPVACAVPAAEYSGKQPWLEALTFSTTNMLKQRASSPPLLRQVRYVCPENAVQTDPRMKVERRREPVQAVMLGLDATVLPLVTTTLEVAEQIRTRLMGAQGKRMGGMVSPAFSGKNPDGSVRTDHGHVYILPLGAQSARWEGRIDRVLILKPRESFTPEELDAVRGVRELWQSHGRPTVRCVVTWQGGLDGQREESRVVVSTTPFVPPRFWRKGRDLWTFVQSEVIRECGNHDLPKPERIEPCDLGRFHAVEYRRNRKDDPVRPGFALRLTFREPVRAPFAIGYGAHFGLGQFRREL